MGVATEKLKPSSAYTRWLSSAGKVDVPTTADELTAQNIAAVINLESQVKQRRSLLDRIVDRITKFCGSMLFVWVHVLWFGGWIGWDILHREKGFDPYPYQLLTLIVSLEAILLSAFILISQNRDARLYDRRNHLALQIALLSEQENTKMLKLLSKIAQKVGAGDGGDPSVEALEEATRPERLAEQIEKAMEADESSDR